ncbi:MAG: hypothetical protein IT443_11025 [Phycisphaeraceae bacterium]|nr:hypothetical protein [Phycisphaeraceae bacterium]
MDLHDNRRLGSPCRSRRLLPKNNIRPRPLWTALTTLTAVMLLATTTPALAEDSAAPGSPGTPGSPAPALPSEAPLLDWSHAQQVYPLIESWIALGAAVDPKQTPAPLPVTGLAGARVTLRWLGRTMGTGDVTFPINSQNQVRDLIAVVRQATQNALLDLTAALMDRNEKARLRAADPDQFKPWSIEDIRPLQVDLQLAHQLEPVQLPPTPTPAPGSAPERDSSFSGRSQIAASSPSAAAAPAPSAEPPSPYEIFHRFAPGYHGLVMLAPGSPAPGSATPASDEPRTSASGASSPANQAWIWPATALAANISPRSQLAALLKDTGTSPAVIDRQIPLIARPNGPTLYRFNVLHLVRPAPNQPITLLMRGNVVLPPVSVTGPTVDDMAKQMTDHLLARLRSDGSFVGTYLPTSDQFDPAQAPLHDVALIAYVLARRAQVLADTSPAPAQLEPTLEACRVALRYLSKTLLPSDAPAEPAARALVILTALSLHDTDDHKIERDAMAQRLITVQTPQGWFVPPAPGIAPGSERTQGSAPGSAGGYVPSNAPTQSLVIAALTQLYAQNRDPKLKEAIEAARQALAAATNKTFSLSTQPWQAMADLTWHSIQPDQTTDPRPGLIREAQILQKLQIDSPPRLGPADVVGGFDPRPTPAESAPNPDWRSANVLAFLAITLRDTPTLPADEQMHWLLDCGLAARFLGQLMFTPTSAFYARSLPDTVGGVRPALWDNRLSSAPTAMALLAVTELQTTLAKLQEPPTTPAATAPSTTQP